MYNANFIILYCRQNHLKFDVSSLSLVSYLKQPFCYSNV